LIGENMKLSKETVGVLKNFASINGNLLIKEGSKLSTISAQKNVMASITVPEVFDSEFAIYDLNEFLGALSLFEDPELEFSEKSVKIKQGNNSIRYYAADVGTLTVPPAKQIQLPSEDISFELSAATLAMIQRTASVLHSADVSVVGDGSKMKIVVADKKNAAANAYEVALSDTDKTFKVNLKVDNLKMIPGNYTITISNKKISRFQANGSDLVYFVAVEADSTFE
jgi:hypothetical protein